MSYRTHTTWERLYKAVNILCSSPPIQDRLRYAIWEIMPLKAALLVLVCLTINCIAVAVQHSVQDGEGFTPLLKISYSTFSGGCAKNPKKKLTKQFYQNYRSHEITS